ncbi:hypothetical protein F2P81_011368 [Scophthalmus maximus]|uniref:Uncharacterized protein n=1 Tax=Scophthalmus maximus TaxID=52904 RepID=A0A6A4SLG9_SCOMX|nr:hypothetical protein F2P81_011368 [Scophthalmus maximus]
MSMKRRSSDAERLLPVHYCFDHMSSSEEVKGGKWRGDVRFEFDGPVELLTSSSSIKQPESVKVMRVITLLHLHIHTADK